MGLLSHRDSGVNVKGEDWTKSLPQQFAREDRERWDGYLTLRTVSISKGKVGQGPYHSSKVEIIPYHGSKTERTGKGGSVISR